MKNQESASQARHAEYLWSSGKEYKEVRLGREQGNTKESMKIRADTLKIKRLWSIK